VSGLYLLVVVAVWVGLSTLLWKAWRRWRIAGSGNRHVLDGFALAIGVVWCGASFWYAGGQKIYYDLQVNRMCAKDGGVKIYETVRLPVHEYDQYAKRNWILPEKVQAKPSDQYYVETDRHYYRQGNPEMSRRQYRIIRRSDGKVLGETILYGRGGGDLPGPWHGSSFTCPDRTGLPNFESSIFVREHNK
jgi:hypothetical protein